MCDTFEEANEDVDDTEQELGQPEALCDPPPKIDVDPTAHNFGDRVVDTSTAALTVTIRNTGGGTLEIAGIALNDETNFTKTAPALTSLVSGASTTLQITFKPTSKGNKAATLTITSNASNAETKTVALSGKGVQAEISVDEGDQLNVSSIAYEDCAVDEEKPKTVTIRNTGNATLNIDSVTLSDESHYNKTDPDSTTIGVGASKTFQLNFKPTSKGKKNINLTITATNASNSPKTIALTGEAINRIYPTITIDEPKIVLVKKDYQRATIPDVQAHRILVTLGLDPAEDFDGTGKLECNYSDHIKLFKAEDPVDELYDGSKTEKQVILDNIAGAELKSGYKILVEAVKPSASVGGTTLSLSLHGGTSLISPDAAIEKITCIELQLDICKSRPDGGDPSALSKVEKIKPGRPVLVQGAATDMLFAERAMLTLHKAKPTDYKGKVLLSSINDKVEVFKEEAPADRQTALTGDGLEFANGSIPDPGGKKLWAQGKTISDSIGDTGFKIGLDNPSGIEGDRVTMSVLEAKLQLCKPRVDSSTKPAPMLDKDKIEKGRFLPGPFAHKEDQKYNLRAKLIVSKVKPDGFKGKLVLSTWDAKATPKAKVSADPKVALFDKETAQTGEKKIDISQGIDHQADLPSEGKAFWVQGIKVSTEAGDTQIRLGIHEYDKGSDRVSLTVANLITRVNRYDAAKLSAAAEVIVKDTGTPTEKGNGDTDDMGWKGFVVPTVKKYDISVTPKTDEATWTVSAKREIGYEVKSNKTGVVQEFEVPADKTVIVRFSLSPYKKVQFIGFNIRPDTKPGKPGLVYLGAADATTDINKRCAIMKKAIQTAHGSSDIDTTVSPPTLKIFMAPEFFYRGAEGGYPLHSMSTIMEEMRTETGDVKYKDWMFVYGTAIGYQKNQAPSGDPVRHEAIKHAAAAMHREQLIEILPDDPPKIKVDAEICEGIEDNVWKVRRVIEETITSTNKLGGNEYEITIGKTDPPKTVMEPIALIESPLSTITAVDGGSDPTVITVTSKLCKNIPANGGYWRAHQSFKKTVEEEIIKCDKVGGKDHDYKLKLKNKNINFETGPIELIEPIATITTIVSATMIKVKSKLCARIIEEVPWKLHQGAHVKEISNSANDTDDIYDLTIDSTTGLTVGPVELTEPKTTEIFNVALVQKGGPAIEEDTSSLKQAIVYKENISPIDFLRPAGGAGNWHDSSGAERVIEIHGEHRRVLPTEGSRDLLGAKAAQNESEINNSGIGGGSVFTIDGITFGLEICLDHAVNKLHDYYNVGAVKSGDPKVQILLIPSWGMSIGGGKVEYVDKGLVFNVDGQRTDSVARIDDGKYYCEPHPAEVKNASGLCPDSRWYCPNTDHWVKPNPSIECPTHNGPLYDFCRACGNMNPNTKVTPAGKCAIHPTEILLDGGPLGKAGNHQGPPFLARIGKIMPPKPVVPLTGLPGDFAKYFSDQKGLTIFETKDIPAADVAT